MNRPPSVIDAVHPAFRHMRRVLFDPFDLGRWIVLGFLSFLQLIGEGSPWSGLRFADAESWTRGAEHEVDEAIAWVSSHWTFVAVVGFVLVLFLLCLVVVFSWLSARGTFCYLSSVATNRIEVVRPWKVHGSLADSYFFWRIIFVTGSLLAFVALAVPLYLSVNAILDSEAAPDAARAIMGSGLLVLTVLVILVLLVAFLLVQTFLTDFVVPIQYVRRIRCSAAFREGLALVRRSPGGFAVYFLLRFAFALAFGVAVFVVGCSTLCVGFCCMMIPVVGQTLLQPYYVFVRSFPLFFLRGFGPGYDAFGPGTPPAPGPTEAWPGSPVAPVEPGPVPAPEGPDPGAGGGGAAEWMPGTMTPASGAAPATPEPSHPLEGRLEAPRENSPRGPRDVSTGSSREGHLDSREGEDSSPDSPTAPRAPEGT